MTAEEARRQAMIEMGGLEQAKEAQRDARGLPAIELSPQACTSSDKRMSPSRPRCRNQDSPAGG
jgi:hypothetical protein